MESLNNHADEIEGLIENATAFEDLLNINDGGFFSLYEASTDISKPQDLSSLLHKIIKWAVRLLNGSSGGIFLCDPDNKVFQRMATFRRPGTSSRQIIKYGEGITGIVSETGKAIIVNNFDSWPGRKIYEEDDKPFTSLISTPIKWKNEVIGVIHIMHDELSESFTKPMLEHLNMVAYQTSIAIQNINLMEKVKNHSFELTSNLQEIEAREEELKGANIKLKSEIEQRIKIEQKSRESEERFKFLVEKSPFGISFMDSENVYKYINPKFIDIFGYTLSDIPTGKEWLLKAYPDSKYREKVISSWITDLKGNDSREERQYTYEVICKNNEQKTILFRSVIMETGEQITFYEDISDKKNLEAQLIYAQKIESLATLAGGIAHNFNNLLMGIQGNTSLMLFQTDESHPLRDRLINIETLIKNGSKLTKQLLGYARKGQYEFKTISLNLLVIETSETFAIARKEIRVFKELAAGGCGTIADQGQIEQVLLNLYVNAADAMPQGGDLILKTDNVTDKDIAAGPYDPKPGDYVRLTVKDTGTGMDEKTMECIFDPFFTTKGLGKGTGLGLASVFGIVKAHQGYIEVDSEPGKGTTFTIYLPRSVEIFMHSTKKQGKIIKGTGHVLLVDDEEKVLEVSGNYLELLGYKVLKSTSGAHAIDIYKKQKENIDLVILDMIMPDMMGGEVYDKLKEINADIKVLLCSGYNIDGEAAKILKSGCNGFLQKPFSIEKLSQNIRGIFDKANTDNQ